jgi:hypothetical protein
MPEVNIDEQDGKFRLTRTEHEFKKGDFHRVQKPVTGRDGKPLDGGGFETDAEAGVHQLKAFRQLNKESAEGRPSEGHAFGRMF